VAKTIFVTTHYMDEGGARCTRVGFIENWQNAAAEESESELSHKLLPVDVDPVRATLIQNCAIFRRILGVSLRSGALRIAPDRKD